MTTRPQEHQPKFHRSLLAKWRTVGTRNRQPVAATWTAVPTNSNHSRAPASFGEIVPEDLDAAGANTTPEISPAKVTRTTPHDHCLAAVNDATSAEESCLGSDRTGDCRC